jgi:hypothetical protein
MEGFRLLKGYTSKTTYYDGLKITLYDMGNKKLSVTLTYHGLPYLYERKGVIDMIGTISQYVHYMELIVRMHELSPEMSHWEIRNYLEDLYINFIS